LSGNITVCILTAGKGSRMGSLGMQLNKALHPIDGKAIISHIINKFPADTLFVIGVGFLGEQVKLYLEYAHENTNFQFIEIDNYDKPGCGPGYSLSCCKGYLQKSFYFVSCDTLWANELDWSTSNNWIGVASVPASESIKYCNVKIINGEAVELIDKTYVEGENFKAFVGLCYIKDHMIFWTALENTELVSGEHQISNGIKALIKESSLFPTTIEWTDVGDAEKYKKEVSLYENYDFSKQNESLYILNGKVIKFFADKNVTIGRVKKSKINTEVFPPIENYSDQFYSYVYQQGETLYKVGNQKIFRNFLNWLNKNLWTPHPVSKDVMKEACLKFYKEKTNERLSLYFKKYPNTEGASCINGTLVPSTSELLSNVPWDILSNGIPSFIHGDLQFDNILYDKESDKFTLLDWRHDFAGNIEFGDLYYDLAKMYGGIILNYDYIKLNLLNYDEDEDNIYLDFAQRWQTNTYLQIMTDFIIDNKYDIEKVRILVALIYLNMSPLHHYPFDKMLYSLGRELLFKEVK